MGFVGSAGSGVEGSGTVGAGCSEGFGALGLLVMWGVNWGDTYLGPAVEVEGVVAVGFEENDNLLDPSLLFKTVFILVTRLLSLFPFSGGAGPSLAGVLMFALV
jgi:hypothetical protein